MLYVFLYLFTESLTFLFVYLLIFSLIYIFIYFSPVHLFLTLLFLRVG
jgi:hypothetical protein